MPSINDYISEVQDILNNSPYSIWHNLEIETRGDLVLILKGSIKYFDESELFFKEYFITIPVWQKINYSYHFQDKMCNLIFRYDNANHHSEIITYPNHKHYKNDIIPSEAISLEKVIEEIISIITPTE